MRDWLSKWLPILNVVVALGALPPIGMALWYMPVFYAAANSLPSVDYINGKFDTQTYVDRQQARAIADLKTDVRGNSNRYWSLKDILNILCYNVEANCLKKDMVWRPPMPRPDGRAWFAIGLHRSPAERVSVMFSCNSAIWPFAPPCVGNSPL